MRNIIYANEYAQKIYANEYYYVTMAEKKQLYECYRQLHILSLKLILGIFD